MKRLSLLAALAVVLALCLLATAGPALAGTSAGSQWGGHEINGYAYIVSIDKYVTAAVVCDDERVSGTMDVSVKKTWYDANGIGHQSGTWDLYNDAGSWHCAYWEALYYFNARSADYPVREFWPESTATGSGAYKGLVFVSASHSAQGGFAILKGWILPAD
jgi:hypothetical protein